ncbi:hypothetical protein FDH34_gp415 [Serratia phage BF]|uniref:Uncharacterized protein n=2 Tax=Eneladusvirus BF TaxID=2560751 RepID=A0A7L8ZPM5_9CAUD|nr:hypothetical protein FDH34_gp415 [Serratia phage BF]AQW89030.1 hypothetical protein BF_0505 [Serratia phage BF]QOI71979.1 hypothetical protein pEaSNUABM47_00530 [Erwinia phage pEa_SNUABM_47]
MVRTVGALKSLNASPHRTDYSIKLRSTASLCVNIVRDVRQVPLLTASLERVLYLRCTTCTCLKHSPACVYRNPLTYQLTYQGKVTSLTSSNRVQLVVFPSYCLLNPAGNPRVTPIIRASCPL